LDVSTGVNTTSWLEEPTGGWVPGETKLKEPETEMAPPIKTELAKVCPWVIEDAAGRTVIKGRALAIEKSVLLDAMMLVLLLVAVTV
jgi:hypothetical protein